MPDVAKRAGQEPSIVDNPWELGMGLLPDQGLLAVQQLLIKGLYRPETEVITIEVKLAVCL